MNHRAQPARFEVHQVRHVTRGDAQAELRPAQHVSPFRNCAEVHTEAMVLNSLTTTLVGGITAQYRQQRDGVVRSFVRCGAQRSKPIGRRLAGDVALDVGEKEYAGAAGRGAQRVIAVTRGNATRGAIQGLAPACPVPPFSSAPCRVT